MTRVLSINSENDSRRFTVPKVSLSWPERFLAVGLLAGAIAPNIAAQEAAIEQPIRVEDGIHEISSIGTTPDGQQVITIMDTFSFTFDPDHQGLNQQEINFLMDLEVGDTLTEMLVQPINDQSFTCEVLRVKIPE